jgi:enoyl-CoA hydratase
MPEGAHYIELRYNQIRLQPIMLTSSVDQNSWTKENRVEHVRLSKEGHVGVVTLDRPPVNAIEEATYRQIADVFGDIDRDKGIRVAVFRAAGTKAFIAGKDLKSTDDVSSPDAINDRFKDVRACLWAIYDCRVPVIAAINGPALGAGLGIAAVCDILVAAESATFGLPEINVGALGGAKMFSRLLPHMLVRYLHLTGEPISATELKALGAVIQLVKAEELLPVAMDIANRIADKSPVAVQLAKRSLNTTEYLDLKLGYSTEQEFSRQLLGHPDSREAMLAFREKRAPVFRSNESAAADAD